MPETAPVPGIPGATARRVDHLPDSLPQGRVYSPLGQVSAGMLLFDARGVGRFLVSGGMNIDYAVEPQADPIAVERFLWGSARSALIYQRRELPLHAAALTRPGCDYAIALCGHSGAGKSSTAAELMRLGWLLLADDLSRIEPTASHIHVWPGPPRLRLCPDACETLGLRTATLASDTGERVKFVIDLEAAPGMRRVAAIVELSPEEGPPRLERYSGAGALAMLSRHSVGPRKARAICSPQERFEVVARIAAGTALWKLYGRKTASARELAQFLDQHFTNESMA